MTVSVNRLRIFKMIENYITNAWLSNNNNTCFFTLSKLIGKYKYRKVITDDIYLRILAMKS